MNNLEIIPLQGLGSIKFGMSPFEVAELMNEAKIYEEWMGGNLNDSLLYHGLILSFDKHDAHAPLKDSKLDWIRIFNRENILLFSKQMSDWTKNSFIQYLEEQNIIYKLHSNGAINLIQLNLEINFEYDNSFLIDFFPLSQENKSVLESILSFLNNLFK